MGVTLRALAPVLAGALGCAVPACSSPRPSTEMIVTVDADDEVRAMATRLEVDVFGRSEGGVFTMEPSGDYAFSVAADGAGWPRVVVLVPVSRDPTRRYRVTATAYRDAAATDEVATVRLISGYVESTSLRFRLYLQAECIGRDCADDETCRDGRCVPATVEPGTLVDGGLEMDASMPDDAPEAADAGGGCPSDCSDGVQCTLDTCEDGECVHTADDSRCDDLVGCTVDSCIVGVGCGHSPQASLCADPNPCTIDACDPAGAGTGCTHDPAPDATGCDDGVFCNGTDVCIGGACAGHTLMRCGPALTCDETDDECDGCTTSAMCPADEIGAYSACTPSASACGASRARAITSYECVSGSCVPSTTYQSDTAGCATARNGEVCGSAGCMPTGPCGGYSDACDETGTGPWSCTPALCLGGACAGTGTPVPESRACTRDTEDYLCGTCGACAAGSCDEPPSCSSDDAGVTDVSCLDGFDCTDDFWDGTTCRHVPNTGRCPIFSCQIATCDPPDAGPSSSGCTYRPDPMCADSGPPPPVDAGSGFDAGPQCMPGTCRCEFLPAFGGVLCPPCTVCAPENPLRDANGCARTGHFGCVDL